MRNLWSWGPPEDRLQRVPRALRAAVSTAFVAWLLIENLARPGHRTYVDVTLSVVTSVAVVAAIGLVWFVPRRTPRDDWMRLGLVSVVAGLGAVSLLSEGINNPGQVATFATVIMASSMGVVGIPIAVLSGGAYVFSLSSAVWGTTLQTWAVATGGALLSVGAAYLLPMWMRYVWRMREQSAATRERERLAREMHDVLAHTLSGLTVQLEATRLLAEQRPGDPAVAEAVANAHGLAREGLLEARRTVSALRGDMPGPAQLEQLLHDFEVESGVRCRLDVEGTPVPLRPEAQLALYRTAQEALTNIRKHADATSVALRLGWSRRGAELTVEDQGTPKPSLAPGGYGLNGIRERAALLGGSLEAGPTEGGFRVRLRVPA
ncbi:MAG: sensor histidine kinase [Candidatus Dormibacteraeota bacterium]|nr:sensor histidine kinase [Candidatus Dormibacteraeota bacterium]